MKKKIMQLFDMDYLIHLYMKYVKGNKWHFYIKFEGDARLNRILNSYRHKFNTYKRKIFKKYYVNISNRMKKHITSGGTVIFKRLESGGNDNLTFVNTEFEKVDIDFIDMYLTMNMLDSWTLPEYKAFVEYIQPKEKSSELTTSELLKSLVMGDFVDCGANKNIIGVNNFERFILVNKNLNAVYVFMLIPKTQNLNSRELLYLQQDISSVLECNITDLKGK